MGPMKWQPPWWTEQHASAWERVKEAMRRDWEQTRHDLKIKGGHQLNQQMGDTMKQAAGKEPIPRDDAPNPPKVVGEWSDIELPIEYGYAARNQYRQHTAWSSELESTLEKEWESGRAKTAAEWRDVRDHVRTGFEAKH